MRRVAPMKTAKIGYIVLSLCLCALGIVFIAMPQFSAKALIVLCAVLLILFGCIRLVGYFSKDLFRLAFQFDFALGLLQIALGVLMLVHPGPFADFVCVILGLSILTDGLFKIQIALDSKAFGISGWWLILLWALVAGALGLTLVLRPGESAAVLAVLLGCSLLAEGILNLITVIAAVKIISHQQPDLIQTDCSERED